MMAGSQNWKGTHLGAATLEARETTGATAVPYPTPLVTVARGQTPQAGASDVDGDAL